MILLLCENLHNASVISGGNLSENPHNASVFPVDIWLRCNDIAIAYGPNQDWFRGNLLPEYAINIEW